jgi:ATP-dependent protease HslVU (ClpYQ) ATPase subunit
MSEQRKTGVKVKKEWIDNYPGTISEFRVKIGASSFTVAYILLDHNHMLRGYINQKLIETMDSKEKDNKYKLQFIMEERVKDIITSKVKEHEEKRKKKLEEKRSKKSSRRT